MIYHFTRNRIKHDADFRRNAVEEDDHVTETEKIKKEKYGQVDNETCDKTIGTLMNRNKTKKNDG